VTFKRFGLLILAAVVPLTAMEYDLRGQLSTRLTGRYLDEKWSGSAGLQYIPQLSLTKTLRRDRLMSAEIAVYGYVNSGDSLTGDNFQPYRLNVRYATARSEIQLGLQKINFGPAQLLRSLMWFDRLDPRDPLKITEGVYGLRFRYNYLNNANTWLWLLYGNDETKGYEIQPTIKDKPEFGGRLQLPVRHGEVALTYHQRYIKDAVNGLENRVAFDGRWDYILGWWTEVVAQYSYTRWTYFTTFGADYTFGIGNGLYTLIEHKINFYPACTRRVEYAYSGMSTWQDYNLLKVSAVMLTYPMTLFDNLMAIGYYSWASDAFYQYVGWQRTYDKLVVNLNFFNYPDVALSGDSSAGAGKGLQLILIYNH
jgi:hypothetical protein